MALTRQTSREVDAPQTDGPMCTPFGDSGYSPLFMQGVPFYAATMGNSAALDLMSPAPQANATATPAVAPAKADPPPAAAPTSPKTTSADWEALAKKRIADDKEKDWIGSIQDSSDRLKDQGYKNSSGAFVGALLDAEAAKDRKGQWKEDSYNSGSKAGGLTQFLPGTWSAMAKKDGTYLNEKIASTNADRKAKGQAALTADEIQNLRFDPDVSIHTAVDYATENLNNKSYKSRVAADAGVKDVKDLSDRDLYYYAYLAHHEGAGGASTLLDVKNGKVDPSQAKTPEEQAAMKKKLDSFLSSKKWSDNVPAKERWKNLEAAGMSVDKLPADVKKQYDAATDDKGKDKVLGDYASKVDKSNLDNQAIFAKAYSSYLDGYIKKQQETWFGKPSADGSKKIASTPAPAATPTTAPKDAPPAPTPKTPDAPKAAVKPVDPANATPSENALAATTATAAGLKGTPSALPTNPDATALANQTTNNAVAPDPKAAVTDAKGGADQKPAATYFEPEKTPTREKFIADYKTHLTDRMAEIQKLPADQRAERIESLLKQVEDVSGRLNGGKFTDLGKLDNAPTGGPGKPGKDGFVPPELISSIRPFIKMVETEGSGSLSKDSKVEGSLYSGTDWNSRLGVPQYRTQSDNLATPEATCNVTSFSMALERLGYNRTDVQSAVERELKTKYLREQKRDPAKEDLSKVELPPEYYGEAVRKYLDENNGKNLKNYQKLRSRATTDAERKSYAEDFQKNAQMEDNLDFLLHLNNIDRTTINGNANKILAKIEPDPSKRPEAVTRQISSKYTYADMKKELGEDLQDGGAAMLSVRHKGKGKSGTHLISVQDTDKTGLVLDDPYGKIRDDYRANKVGDAYATAGNTRANSGLANKKHNGATGTDKDDWKVKAAQNLSADESRGDSVHSSDAQAESMLNYITMFRRPGHRTQDKKPAAAAK